jgi:putative NIF3 family GTP cyclohydrolase 1 type 2
MPVTCRDIACMMEYKAPPVLSADWDNSGLIIGDENSQVDSILVCLDINDEVIDEWLQSNICRCTSYEEIRNAINDVHKRKELIQ